MTDERPISERPKRPDILDKCPCPTCAYTRWLERERDRLEAAIRQKDNAFEVCEERRWEAEERVGALMDEIECLKAPPKKITNLDVQREIDRNSNGTDIYGDSF